jgi:hypothetical protein
MKTSGEKEFVEILANILKMAIEKYSPSMGFALVLFDDGKISYVSDNDKQHVAPLLHEIADVLLEEHSIPENTTIQ